MKERVKITITLGGFDLPYYVTEGLKAKLKEAKAGKMFLPAKRAAIKAQLQEEIGNDDKVSRILTYFFETRKPTSEFAKTPLGQFCLGISSLNKTIVVFH